MSMNNKKSVASRLMSFLFTSIILIIVFLSGYFLGHKPFLDATSGFVSLKDATIYNKGSNKGVDFKIFWESWDLLKSKYVERNTIDSKDLIYGAIKGMYASTGDPYTTFFDPEENKKFSEVMSGSFEGIGAEIGIKDNFLTIVSPLDGSPAKKAGLRPKDRIIAIDDEQITEPDIDELVKKIRGEQGTDVKLSILREGEDDIKDIVITRAKIQVNSVKLEKIDDISYIRVSQFGETASSEFKNAMDEVKSNNSKGIIIDLRNNPGGLLTAAVDLVGYFVPNNSVVVTEEYSKTRHETKKTHRKGEFKDLPMVILINEGSASASEIFAGALKDNRDDVVLVGKKSFGKGSVQELIPMRDKTSTKITVAKWLTPKGSHIDKVGIEPDVSVEYTEDDYKNEADPQKDKALEIIKEKL